MKILPSVGLDIISFGASKEEVVATLGEPSKTYLSDSDGEKFQYDLLMIELSFEPEHQNRFGWLEVHNPDCTFAGERFIGQSMINALPEITKILNDRFELEDHGSFESRYFDQSWVEIQSSFNVLRCINLGVVMTNLDEALWPQK